MASADPRALFGADQARDGDEDLAKVPEASSILLPGPICPQVHPPPHLLPAFPPSSLTPCVSLGGIKLIYKGHGEASAYLHTGFLSHCKPVLLHVSATLGLAQDTCASQRAPHDRALTQPLGLYGCVNSSYVRPSPLPSW